MSKLFWDKTGERRFEAGVDQGVLYLQKDGAYPKGVAWNGLTAVNESPSGAEPNPQYANNHKYLNLLSAEEYGCTIEAFTYPLEFEACDGSAEITAGLMITQQTRKPFGFSYRTRIGNDVENLDYGYKIHMVYGALAAPSEKNHESINESPEASVFSWEITTTPVEVPTFKPTAHLVADSTTFDKAKLATLEGILYGTDVPGQEARLPTPDELVTLFGEPIVPEEPAG